MTLLGNIEINYDIYAHDKKVAQESFPGVFFFARGNDKTLGYPRVSKRTQEYFPYLFFVLPIEVFDSDKVFLKM